MSLQEVFQSFLHPSELYALARLKLGRHMKTSKHATRGCKTLEETIPLLESDRDFCYAALHHVSRSFALVISALAPSLQDSIAIFYLVLRGLDSVEDDMSIDMPKKIQMLKSFYLRFPLEKGNCYNYNQDDLTGVGDTDDYRTLMTHFGRVINLYLTLPLPHRQVIVDITRRMGDGMAEFVPRSSRIGTTTVSAYNLYCHYVAGLVGIGLTKLFSLSGDECQLELLMIDRKSGKDLRDEWSNSMGLFLQKVNIIRDYKEDLDGGRAWWPQQIWRDYARDNLADFALAPHSPSALACMNALVYDALQHLPHCLSYLCCLSSPSVFAFCAIPQVMALATLCLVFNNADIFIRPSVKIRKGITARILLECDSFENVRGWVKFYLATLFEKCLKAKDQMEELLRDEQKRNACVSPRKHIEKHLEITLKTMKKIEEIDGMLNNMESKVNGLVVDSPSLSPFAKAANDKLRMQMEAVKALNERKSGGSSLRKMATPFPPAYAMILIILPILIAAILFSFS